MASPLAFGSAAGIGKIETPQVDSVVLKPGAISFCRPNLGFNNGFNNTECPDARIFLP
jgi:hypothetical protein